MPEFVFPFDQHMRQVLQVDRTPKKLFALGFYGSAVHVRWLDPAGRTVAVALAVASEPWALWDGTNPDAAEVVAGIPIPPGLGTLVPAGERYNGPSGRALRDLFLDPLRCTRRDAWLCDMVPHIYLNPGQRKTLERAYDQIPPEHGLPRVTIPRVPPYPVPDEFRKLLRVVQVGRQPRWPP